MSPEPGVASSQVSRAASDFTARRLVASAPVLMPSRLTLWIAVSVRRKLPQALPSNT